VKDDSGIVTAENADENNSDAVMNSQELAQSSCSLLATALADLNDDIDGNDGGEDTQSILRA